MVPVVERPDIHRLELLPVAREPLGKGTEGGIVMVMVHIAEAVVGALVVLEQMEMSPMAVPGWRIRFSVLPITGVVVVVEITTM